MTLRIQYRDHRGKPVSAAFSPDDDKELFIGRRDAFTPQVNLTWDRQVSRNKHARIYYEMHTWYIEHLSQSSQTQLNGALLALGVPRELPAKAEVIVGATPLTITHDAGDAIPDGIISKRSPLVEPEPDVSETQRFDVLAEITSVLADAGDDQLKRLLDVILPHFPTMYSGGIALYRDKEIYNPVYFPPSKAEISFNLARRALEDRCAFRWDRQIATAENEEFTSLFGTTQALYVPILRGVNRLGVIYMHSQSKFEDADLSRLKTISEIIGANESFDPATAHLRLPSVFISYSHQNTEFVKKLVADVRRQRVTVWFDERLRGGKDWQEQLAHAIEQSDAFGLVMSPDSLASVNVQWEIDKARAANKPIFPLRYQASDNVPDDLAGVQYIDLLADYPAGVRELVDELYEYSGEEDKLDMEPIVPRAAGQREKTRILFLAANPSDTDQLSLREEIRTIQERIRGGTYRDQFDMIQQGWAVRFSDLQQYLLEYKPHIVHFSGHGDSAGQIIMENHTGKSQPVDKQTLKILFNALRDNENPADGIQLVVLNACFSAIQAEALVEEVGCVLGMTREVSDTAAIEFAGSFYNALTFAKSVQTGFNLATAAMSLTGEAETPELLTARVNASELVFCEEK